MIHEVPPVEQRPLTTLLGGIRQGTSQMARDIFDAHRGPKPNTRDVPDWVRSLAWLLDDSIPVAPGRHVGIDGLMSFVPGIGDAAGLVASVVVVLAGVAAGVTLPTTTLMMINVGLDTIIGAVPFVGALFDLGYKSNTRNLRLIERDLADRAGARRSGIRVIVLTMLVIFLSALLLFVALVGSIYLFARLILRLF